MESKYLKENNSDLIESFDNSISKSDFIQIIEQTGFKRLSGSDKFHYKRQKNTLGAELKYIEKNNRFCFNIYSETVKSELIPTRRGTWSFFPFEFLKQNIFKSVFSQAITFVKTYVGALGTAVQWFKHETIPKIPEKEDFKLKNSEPIFKFQSSELEIKSINYEQDLKITRAKADAKVIREHPNAEKERLFRVMVNRNIRNKDIKGKELDFTWLFFPEKLSSKEIASEIKKGYAIVFSDMQKASDEDSQKLLEYGNYHCKNFYTRRSDSKWNGSELVAIDIDNMKDGKILDKPLNIEDALAMEMTKKAMLIYTTCSDSENNPRFRIVFDLDVFVQDPNTYKGIIRTVINSYKPFCDNLTDLTRPFFGNQNAKIWLRNNDEQIKEIKYELNSQ